MELALLYEKVMCRNMNNDDSVSYLFDTICIEIQYTIVVQTRLIRISG